jgi:hypothetical protein
VACHFIQSNISLIIPAATVKQSCSSVSLPDVENNLQPEPADNEGIPWSVIQGRHIPSIAAAAAAAVTKIKNSTV